MVKSISYCCLFAMTPRAGRWNHRYLVPPGMVWTEKELAELVSEADARPMGSDYIAIVRTVTQTSTGRKASEMLILTDPRLAQLGPKDRDEVLKKLREYSDRLEDLVTRQIDWEQAGVSLVVERPELGVWQRELESTLRHLVGPATALTERTAVVGRKAAPGRFQVWKWGVVISALLLVGIALGKSSCLRQVYDWLKKSVPISKENFSVQEAQDHNNQNLAELREKLVSLIEWSDSKERNVDKALEVFYSWVHGRGVPPRDVPKGDLQDALKKLQVEGNRVNNPLGLLSDEDQKTAPELGLDKIDPVQLRRAYRALIELHNIDLKPEQVGTGMLYSNAVEELRNKQLPQVPEGPEPKFYVSKDVKYAEHLKNLLSSEAWRNLIGGDRNEKLDGLLSAVRKARSPKNSPVAKETLEIYKNTATHQDVQNWYDKLGEFVEACAEAAPDPQDLKVSGRSSE